MENYQSYLPAGGGSEKGAVLPSIVREEIRG
jgi:hypothetical protein